MYIPIASAHLGWGCLSVGPAAGAREAERPVSRSAAACSPSNCCASTWLAAAGSASASAASAAAACIKFHIKTISARRSRHLP